MNYVSQSCIHLSFLKITLADYSISNIAFDQVERWKDTLKHLVMSCNQTQALGAMIPQLEEFVVVARSESIYQTIRGLHLGA